jgi:hypothetical protein
VAPGASYLLALLQLVQVPVGAGLVYAGLKYGAASLAFYREIAGQCPCSEMRSLGFNNYNAAARKESAQYEWIPLACEPFHYPTNALCSLVQQVDPCKLVWRVDAGEHEGATYRYARRLEHFDKRVHRAGAGRRHADYR